MKRIVALLLLIVLVVSFVGCDRSGTEPEKAEKYCYNCGSPITKNVSFCEHCGAKMPSLNEDETSNEAGVTPENSEGFTEEVKIDEEENTEKITPETEAPNHTHTYSLKTVAATCTTDGYTEYTCSCGYTYKSDTVLAKGHSYIKSVVSPTCRSDGYTTYTCSCGYTYTESLKLQTYTATELYDQSVKYVGEIITYDNKGNEYALGTGFVISADGKIVTNYHVIEDAYAADITINNKKYTVDSVLAYDTNIDLAVLKINASGLPYARICKLPVNVGTTVYAIGSSRGMTNTCSQGIVTYADRIIDGISYVQHDASITHGNSGGPLINEYGEVIGINTWGISDSQNLNFAIFVDELDNLTYGISKTLAELCRENKNPYEYLAEWVMTNGTADGNDRISVAYYYEKEGGLCGYYLSYSKKSGYLTVSKAGNYEGSSYFTAIYLDDFFYYSSFEETNISGFIEASAFTANSEITHTKFEGNSADLQSMLNIARYEICDLIGWLDWVLGEREIGITIKDLGFKSY